jgi:hypothetical protein
VPCKLSPETSNRAALREKRARIALKRRQIKHKPVPIYRTNGAAPGGNIYDINVLHTVRSCLALTLFVAAILADDPHYTLAPYDLAIAADTLD